MVASDDEDRVMGNSFHDFGSHFNSSAILHQERKWRRYPEDDFPFDAEFSPVSRFSLLVRHEKFSPVAFPPKPAIPTSREIKIDFVCKLPMEIAAIVLGFLDPQDLCRYERVARCIEGKERVRSVTKRTL